MSISTVQYLNDDRKTFRVTYSTGKVLFVPEDEANQHYQGVVDWVAAGGEIDENPANNE